MRIGQVRVIFSIPESTLPFLFPSGNYPPRHLAYIEWFSNFTTPDRNLKLYKVSRSFKNGDRLVSILPVSHIRRSVHLFPKWGTTVDMEWTMDSVLEDCSVFFLNSFKDRHTYFNVY